MTDSTGAAPTTSQTAQQTRRAAVRGLLQAQGLDSLLVTDLLNIRYLTGFTGSNAALLIDARGDDDSRFCTDSRYLLQAGTEVPDLPQVIDRPCDLALVRTAHGRVGFESHIVTVAAHAALLEQAQGELVPVSYLVEQRRATKDDAEIDALRRACGIADQALAELIAAGGIRPGRTEREVSLELDQRMRLLGAQDPAYETIFAAGPNSAIPHHRPSAAVLAAGDFVKIDFGALVDGYHSDMTRTFVLGNPADWQRDLYALVHQAQAAGRAAVRIGATGEQIDAAARDVIAAAGFGEQFGHGLGHGVGLQVHEAPSLARGSAAIMSADMCVTVEPGVYLPGRGGVRIEDCGVVRPDGYEVLTLTDKELLVL